MELLDRIKKLFRSKKAGSNVGIAEIDTSLTYIIEYSDLSSKDKKVITREIKRIIDDKYKELIKYTQEQDSAVNDLQEFLRYTLLRYDKQYQSIKDRDTTIATAKRINYIMLSANEYELILNKFLNIRKELEIKFHVINRIIQRFKKNSLLTNKEQKTNYLANKSTIFSIRDIIKTSIKNIDNLLIMMQRQINESNLLIQSCDILGKCNTISDTDHELLTQTKNALTDIFKHLNYGYNPSIKEKFKREIKEKILDRIQEFHTDFDKDLFELITNFLARKDVLNEDLEIHIRDQFILENKKLVFTMYFLAEEPTRCIKYLVDELPNDLLLVLYKIIAKYIHDYETIGFYHRNDYKIYLKEVEDLTNKCFSTPVENWRSSNISPYSSMLQFSGNGIQYSHMCRNYLTDEIREQMRVAFARLNWLANIGCCGLHGADPGNYLDEPDANLWDEKEVWKYFHRFSEELLTKVVEKFGVEIEKLRFIKKDENHIASEKRSLIALLNGVYNAPIYVSPSIEYPLIYKQHNTKKTITSIGKDKIELNDFYYFLKHNNIEADDIDFRKIAPFYLSSQFTYEKPDEFANFVALIRLKQLEKQYDNRILISPNLGGVANTWWKDQLLMPNNSFIAALSCDIYMMEHILCVTIIRQKLKYLFIKKTTLEEFRKAANNYLPEYHAFFEKLKRNGAVPINNNETLAVINLVNICFGYFNDNSDHIDFLGLKVIIIPDDTTYSELSDLLNQELTKDNPHNYEKR